MNKLDKFGERLSVALLVLVPLYLIAQLIRVII